MLKLEWMAKHRLFVEKIIKYGNAYAAMYNKQLNYHTDILFSAAQIQVIEYVLENENQKMIEIARRLGITRGAFSKNVKKLMDKGLLEKFYCNNNRKNIYVKPTLKGRETYEQYTDYVYNIIFKDLFDIADEISSEDIEKFKEMLEIFSEQMIWLLNKSDDDEMSEKIFTKIE